MRQQHPAQAQVAPTPPCPGVPAQNFSECSAEDYSAGSEVVLGGYRFRCRHVLGRGSFGEVWSAETMGAQESMEVALKDIVCQGESDMQQALFEVNLLKNLQVATPGEGSCIPQYFAHGVVQKSGGSSCRVRVAMSRVPGEPVDTFVSKPPPVGQDGPVSVRRGCGLATQLIKQLGPTLERVNRLAWHRDVNSHNVLVSDAVTGGNLGTDSPAENARFWLIDFGLAVDSRLWPSAWPKSDIGGDCRYWPPSSWLMSFHGAPALLQRADLRHQYETRLDIFGLGVLALELLCTHALVADDGTGSTDSLRGAWRRLMTAWSKFRRDVTRWHTTIYKVFSAGGDIGPVYVQLRQERVVEKVLARLAAIRTCLTACIDRAHDPAIQTLLWVLCEMLDENSTLSLGEAVNALNGDMSRSTNQAAVPPRPQGCPHSARPETGPAKFQWGGPPANASYTPPAGLGASPRPVHVESCSKHFTPRDGSVPARHGPKSARANLAGA